jgi:hypothetical protein
MLILKQEYMDARIMIKHPKVGEIVFDSNKTNPTEYQFFFENGLDFLFQELKSKKYKGIEQNGE